MTDQEFEELYIKICKTKYKYSEIPYLSPEELQKILEYIKLKNSENK